MIVLVMICGQLDSIYQVVYILDQVRALEGEMLKRIKQQGLDIVPRILIVSYESLKKFKARGGFSCPSNS